MTFPTERDQIEQLWKEIRRLRKQVDFLMSRVPEDEIEIDEELASLLEDRRKNLEKQFKIW